MTQILSYFPGQIATIFIEVKDGYGTRTDGYSAPIVNSIINPALTLIDGYPQFMTKLDTGLFYFKFTLPKGGTSIGSYLVNVFYFNPTTGAVNSEIYQITVNAPFGNFGVTTSI